MHLRRLVGVLSLAVLLAACGDDGGRDGGGDDAGLPRRTWTWVDVPGAQCADGSPTGIGVSRGDDDARVVVLLDGGGACWDAVTCFELRTASAGPFGAAQLPARLAELPGSALDRALPGNPWAGATLVFVPYCTGDVHAGDAVQDYPGAPRPWRHRGRANVEAALGWLGERLPAPGKVVISGASAGGFGALLALDHAARRWPSARAYLVDDSGPPLVGDDFSPLLRAAWFAAWRLDRTLLPLCPDCALDLSALLPVLARAHPGARLALLSSRQDRVIRGYVGLGPAGFEAAVLRLVDERVAPLAQARAFLVPGDGHTMLGAPAAFTSGDVTLLEWLRRMVEDEAGWTTAGR